MLGPLAVFSARFYRTKGGSGKREDGKRQIATLERKRGHGEL